MTASRRPTRPTAAATPKPAREPKAAAPKAGAAPKGAAAPKAGAASKAGAAPRQARAPRQPGARQPIAAVAAGWLGGIRFSGFSIIMMGVLVLAVVALAPSIAAYAAQRQQIAEIRAAVSAQEAEVQRLQDERERWNDETFIVTQARERLYYVMPGEVSYLVIDDRSAVEKADAATGVSAEVTESKGDWMRTLLRSVMTAGLAPAPSDVPAATDAPATEGAQ